MFMPWEDTTITVLMMSSIIRQLRGRPLTWFSLGWPIALVVYAGSTYLGHVPADRGDVLLVMGLVLLGAVLGLTCGVLSRVYPHRDGSGRVLVMVRSTGTAAVLWIVGMGSRLGFALYAEHGGYGHIESLDARLGVTSFTTWSNALILMALCEVAGRTMLLAPRLHRLNRIPA